MNKIRVDFLIQKRKHGGSCPQRKPNLERKKKRQHGQDKIWRDCFFASLIYDDGLLRKNHRMKWTLFLCILDSVYAHDSYFCKYNMHLAT